jgi:hypothetical protein
MFTLRLSIIFRIICVALALSTLLDGYMYAEQVNKNLVIELNNNSIESSDDIISKQELPCTQKYLFNTFASIEYVCNYTNHYNLQYNPEITPPPPKVV